MRCSSVVPFVIFGCWVLGLGFPLEMSMGRAQGLTSQEKFFEDKVRPLLLARCQECHSVEVQESDLRLDSRTAILRGGLSGSAAIPRDPEHSLMLRVVRGEDGLERMPPDDSLGEEEIAILQRWIAIGMPWPASDQPVAPSLGDQTAIVAAAKQHWAFQPIRQPALPAEVNSQWVSQPIDAFVLQQLKDAGLSPSSPADRRTLIRRVTFDVTGLPPSAAAVEAFVNDPASDDVAFGSVVDGLLAAPQYGERWARYWLDLARYADTRDWQAQAELRYPYAFTYRDYVIGALNEDKPFDQFVREQLAADAYADSENAAELAALGFLTVVPRFRNNRLEQVADRVDVVTRGLMGITVSCARCHDHKYDPVTIEDYYALYGVFASCSIPDTLPRIGGVATASASRRDLEAKLAAKQRDWENYGKQLRQQAVNDLQRQISSYMAGYFDLTVARRVQIRGILTKHKVKEFAMTPFAKELDDLVRGKKHQQDPVLGPLMEGLALSEKPFSQQAGKLLADWQAQTDINPVVQTALTQAAPRNREQLVAAYGDLFSDVLRDWKIARKADPQLAALPDADSEAIRATLLAEGGLFDLPVEAVVAAARLLGGARRKQGDLQKAITEVEATHPGAPPRAMVLVDNDKPLTPFVMLRGEPARRGERVPRRFLSILSDGDPQPFRNGSGRRDLAEAIVAEDNPLTARLLVNRVWSRYFGAGLATSLDDFGLRSEPPSHPELLDHLAYRFLHEGWSLKALHRSILTSQTYRQACTPNAEAEQLDPENRLLWRQKRRRLDFEAMRDALLAAAGTLDLQVGGRSVALSKTPFTHRRTVYAYVDRVELDPILRTFDFASPFSSSASRSETTIPQQSLFAMNHPFVAQCAKQLATSVQEEVPAADRATIVEALYRRLFARRPTANERRLAEQFLSGPVDSETLHEAAAWQYGYGPIDRTISDQPLTALPFWTGKLFQVGPDFPDSQLGHLRVTAAGAHPGRDAQHAVILRWTAPGEGTVKWSGEVQHQRDAGDGITMRLVLPDGTVHQEQTLKNARASLRSLNLTVRPGDHLELVVDCRRHASSDAFLWSLKIEGVDGALAGRVWDSIVDFKAPPPPPLTPLEQFAQALLLTNEFLYLD